MVAQNESLFPQIGLCFKEPGLVIKEAQAGHGEDSVASHITENFFFDLYNHCDSLCVSLPLCQSAQRSNGQRLNYTKMMDDTFFDTMDQWIRIGAAQIRTLKLNQCDWLRVAKKSSQEEKTAIEAILELVSVEPCSWLSPS